MKWTNDPYLLTSLNGLMVSNNTSIVKMINQHHAMSSRNRENNVLKMVGRDQVFKMITQQMMSYLLEKLPLTYIRE